MAQQPPNPKPRRLTPCHRHPNISTTTGLCAPCLRERLSLLNPSTTSGEASTSTAGVLPELRRCKTFSAKNCDVVFGMEPRRRSCDVRGRKSLSSLFDIDDDVEEEEDDVVSVESRFLSKGTCTVVEEDEITIDEGFEVEARVSNFGNVDEFDEGKTMKEFIDLEFEGNGKISGGNKKDFKEIAGSFWIAASVFSKKFQKWGKKQKREKFSEGNGGGGSLGEMKLENLRGRRLRDTQSEVGDYGFGRRSCDTDPRGSIDLGRASIDCGGFGRKSCDTDPRFSIDLGRASVDCGRISVDEARRSEFDAPRASWDGYLVGGRAALPRGNGNAPMVSVIENAMATVYGFDNRVLSEGKMKVENGSDRERWRNGFDRSSSVKNDMGVIEDDGEAKGLSNAKVSPAAIGIFNGTKLLITEKELNEWRLKSNSNGDDSSESFETASKDLASVSSSSNGKGFKKCRQWSKLWSMWGLLNRRKGDKFGTSEERERENLESLDADSVDHSARRLARSHSTSSSRGSSSTIVGSVGGIDSRNESKAIVRSRQEAVVSHRNRSARYSPNHVDNGLLRFYLTPLRSRRRSNRLGKSRLKNSKSLAKSLKLY
ncbi:protein OCTOPUS [Beta vulgaris subsp. vulgaris]|uniref:protein OCTOPUS n=1 Tax=Beta vulgaris subsp. vulgaris TaxID=3555 RepID=UPI002036E4E4|nr:protein OCTOPUS [Beta vulgaris subsp. vulgaris]